MFTQVLLSFVLLGFSIVGSVWSSNLQEWKRFWGFIASYSFLIISGFVYPLLGFFILTILTITFTVWFIWKIKLHFNHVSSFKYEVDQAIVYSILLGFMFVTVLAGFNHVSI